MRYGILGTTQALLDDGTPVPLGGARLRALLAALALRAGRPVAVGVLVEEVWDGDAPADPGDALQTLVARLRRALGREAVLFGPEGYRLADPETDLARFSALTAEARATADPARTAVLLREALGLWRGPALADLPARADAAARAEGRRLDALRRRLAADLALGRAEEVLPELTGLAHRHPLDEVVHALLLRALHGTGRTAEALTGYEALRRRLDDRLGTRPGAELQRLHRQLLTPGAPSGPAAQGAPSGPPAGPGPEPPTNLRPRRTSFVGREPELAALRAALPGARLLTLTGPGGSGKTRLALEAAEGHPAFPDGSWLVELAALDGADPRAVPDAAVSALGLRETVLAVGAAEPLAAAERADADPAQRLLDHCARRRLLLVLDNCEHLLQPAAELVDRLLAACPGVTVLATSREPLGVPGERIHPVGPLADDAALRLLAERGAAVRPGFDPWAPGQDPAACAEVCRRLDGLPLAIELAAARLAGLTPRQLVERLDARFHLLGNGSRTALPRQQTLRAVVEWSWELLDTAERTLLRRLSVFAGGCTLDAAEQVCADEELPAAGIAPLLAALVDKSLVVADLGAARPRYRMLETIHAYARERLRETRGPEPDGVRRRHLRHYRELVRTADPLLRGPEQLHWLEVLEGEHENLRAALRRAIADGAEQDALCLVLSLAWYWVLRDYSAEAHAWCLAVAGLGPEDPFAGPVEPAPAAPVDLPPPWPPAVLADARRGLRVCLLASDEAGYLRAPEEWKTRLAHAVFAAYPSRLPQSARFPGIARIHLVMYAGAVDRLYPQAQELVECCRAHGRDWELAYALQMRARTLNDRAGAGERARRDAEESLELFTRAGDRWGVAQALAALAEDAAFRWDFGQAVEYWRRAAGLAEEMGARQELTLLRVRLGDALLATGEVEAGERLLRDGIAQASDGPSGQGARFFGTLVLAAHLASLRRLGEARALLQRLLPEDAGTTMTSVFAAIVVGGLSWIDVLEGEPERAMRRLRTARADLAGHPLLGLMERQVAQLLLPNAVCALLACARAGAPSEPDAARRGAELLGASDALNGRLRVHHLARRELEAAERGLRESLGEDAFAVAYAAGAAAPDGWDAALLGTGAAGGGLPAAR